MSGEAQLMQSFYRDLGSECSDWYAAASKKFARDAEAFTPWIEDLGDHKYMIMNYANEEFHTIKNAAFTIVDSLIDSQRTIESTEDYFQGKSLKAMKKRLSSPQWKFQLKYSTKMTKRCAYDASRVQEFSDKVAKSAAALSGKMEAVMAKFSAGARADYKAWNCMVMYPRPKPIDLGVPKWLGGLTKAAKTGFQIYNTVKDLIPGGTKAGAGPVPGSGEELEEELALFDFPKVKFDDLPGMGEKLIGELDKYEQGKKDTLDRRIQIWSQAIDMCETDKAKFVDESEKVKTTIRKMS
jgi:hypothetical protein